jgi:hypothetical protein
MAKKKKSKLKKFLKGAALAGAAALGASALGRRKQMKDYLSTEGGDISRIDGRDFGPYKKQPVFIKPRMMTSEDMAKDPFFTGAETLMNDTRAFKKGGRVGCGIAKKGFGKALKKGGRK